MNRQKFLWQRLAQIRRYVQVLEKEEARLVTEIEKATWIKRRIEFSPEEQRLLTCLKERNILGKAE